MRFGLTCVLVSLSAHAWAEPTTAAPPQQVVVNGSQSDVEASRDFVAGKIVIGKARIAESGLQNVGELLNREPAVSVGKDGRIGLLGLPGYTQVLVDGMPPQGDTFSLDLIHIERIEIIKSSTAATGPIGIAGTINIIRRKAQRTSTAQLNGGVSRSAGLLGGDLAWSTGGAAAGLPLLYSLRLSAMHKPVSNHTDYVAIRESLSGTPAPDYAGQFRNWNRANIVSASSEFTWNINSAHTLTLSPEASYLKTPRGSREGRIRSDGSSLLSTQDDEGTMAVVSLPLRWDWRIDPESSLSVKLNVNRTRNRGNAQRRNSLDGIPVDLLASRPEATNTNAFLHLDYTTEWDNGHALTAGAKFAHNRSANTYADFFNGLPDPSLAVLGPDDASRLRSGQLFIQDEWRINRSWALNAGSSVERRAYRLREGPGTNKSQFTMWAPSVHVSRKIGADRKRQVRLSVARSFRPPFFDELLLRPVINTFAPCRGALLCGANTLDTADIAGNPGLLPERALGVNLSYSHGIGKDSEVTLEAYARDLQNKTGYELALADVPWATAPRYVVRQANLGTATIRGLNLEARLSGKDLAPTLRKGLARLELHGSVGLAHSRLSDIPGPDNHIVGQSPWRAKIGGSYALQAVPVKLGVDASYLPSDWVRDSVNQRVFESGKLVLGMNASWTVSKQTRLVLNLDNLAPRTRSRIDEYLGVADVLRRSTTTSNHARMAIRLETKL